MTVHHTPKAHARSSLLKEKAGMCAWRRLALAAAFCLAAGGLHAATVTWTNSAGGNWSTAANWSAGAAPGPGDIVDLTMTGSYTITLDISATVGGINLGGASGAQTLLVSGQTLDVAGPLNIGANGVIKLSSGVLQGAGAVTNNGSFEWSGGTITGSGSFSNSGTFNLIGASDKTLDGRTLTNVAGSRMMWTGGRIVMRNGAVIRNQGFFDITVDNSISDFGGAGTAQIRNSGTLSKSAGTGITTVGALFVNTGSCEINAGTLRFSGGGVFSGSVLTQTAALAEFNSGTYDWQDNAAFSGTGQTRIAGAIINTSGTGIGSGINSGHALAMTGGTISGSGKLTVSGTFNWQGGTITGTGSLTVGSPLNISGASDKSLDGRTITLTGAANWTGGRIVMRNQAGINIGSTGQFNIQTDNNVEDFGGTGVSTITNGGAIVRDTTTGTATVKVQLTGAGSLGVNTGVLSLQGGGNAAGNVAVANGAKLQFGGGTFAVPSGATWSGGGVYEFSGGTVGFNGTFSGSGAVAVTGGTLNIQTAATIPTLDISGGVLGGTGNVVANGGTWSGGKITGTGGFGFNGPLTINSSSDKEIDGRTVSTNATTTWALGRIVLRNGGTISNAAGGTWDIQTDNSVVDFGLSPAGKFINAGTLTRTTGTGVAEIAAVFDNTGTLQVSSGELRLTKGGAQGGAVSVTGGAMLNYSAGTYSLTDGAAFSGSGLTLISGATVNGTGTATGASFASGHNLRFTSGILGGSGPIAVSGVFDWRGGTITGTGSLTVGSPLNISGASDKSLDGRTITLTGAANWTGGRIVMRNQAGINIGSTGQFNIETDNTIIDFGGSGPSVIRNAGSVVRGTGTGTAAIDVDFQNSGQVSVQSGVLQFKRSCVQTSGGIGLQGGALTVDALLDIRGGGLGGSGTITGNVSNGGTVAPGFSPGTLTITGNYTQTASGSLMLDIGGLTPDTQHDVFNVSGAAALDGTIDVSLLTFTPADGDTFRVMAYGSRTGDFATNNLTAPGGIVFQKVYDATGMTLKARLVTDLSLTKTVDVANPIPGETVTFTLTVLNGGPNDVTGVQVTDSLQTGLTLTSSTPSQGTYDSATGLWSVGAVAANGSATLQLAATVQGTGVIPNMAEIIAASLPDPDSTPNNMVAGEDDQAAASISVRPTVIGCVATAAPSTSVRVRFSEDVNATDVVTAANYTITQGGSAVSLAGATLNYNATNFTVTIAGGSLNFAVGDTITVTVTNVHDLDGNAIAANNSCSVTAGDQTPPRVASCEAAETGSGFIKVVFSENVDPTSASNAGNFAVMLNGSPFDISGATLTYDSAAFTTTITLTGAAPVAGQSFGVQVASVADLAGNVVDPTANSCTGTVRDAIPPSIASCDAAQVGPSSGIIRVVFSEKVDSTQAGTAANFTINHAGAALDLSGATLTYNPVTTTTLISGVAVTRGSLFDITVANIADLAGNVITAGGNMCSGTVRDAIPPRVLGCQAAQTGSGYIDVRFSEDVDSVAATTAANFTVGIAGSPLDITGATLTYDAAKFVTRIAITGAGLNQGDSFSLTVSNVTDSAGNAIDPAANSCSGTVGDAIPPTVVSCDAVQVGPAGGGIRVVFSEPVNAPQATDAANYTVNHGGAALDVTGATFNYDPATKTVTIGGVPVTQGSAFDVLVANVTDVAGNVISMAASCAGTVRDGVRPSIAQCRAARTATGVIEVVFSEDVDAAAASNAANFTVGVNGSPLDITTATLTYDSTTFTTEIVLTAGGLQVGQTFAVQVANIADLAGNLIDAAKNNCTGTVRDAIPPAVATCDAAQRTPNGGFVAVVFSKPVDPAQAGAAANFAITQAGSPVDLSNATVTYDPNKQATLIAGIAVTQGSAFDVTVSNVTDAAGNALDPGGNSCSGIVRDGIPPVIAQCRAAQTGSGVIQVVFSEAMDVVSARDVANYSAGVNGTQLDLTAATITYDPASFTTDILITGSGLVAGQTFGVQVSNVADAAGNALDPNGNSCTGVVRDALAPTVVSCDAAQLSPSGGAIRVVFSEPVKPAEAASAANFSATHAGSPLDLSTATFNYNAATMTTIIGGVPVMAGNVFEVTVSNLTDLAGNAISPAPSVCSGTVRNAITPAVVQCRAAQTGSGVIQVVFSRDMDPAGAVDAANFAVGVNGSPLDLSTATLTYDPATFATDIQIPGAGLVAGQTFTVKVNNLTDAGGTPIDPAKNTCSGTIRDASAPSVASCQAVQTGSGAIRIVYSEPVRPATATNPANFALTQAGTAIDLAAASFNYDPNANATIITSPDLPLQQGQPFEVTVNGVTDAAGNAIPAQTVCSGIVRDGVPPEVASCSAEQQAQGGVVRVTFSEDVDAAAATTPANFDLAVENIALDITGADFTYDGATMTTTISGPAVRVRNGRPFAVRVSQVADTAGNLIATGPTSRCVGQATAASGAQSVQLPAGLLMFTVPFHLDNANPLAVFGVAPQDLRLARYNSRLHGGRGGYEFFGPDSPFQLQFGRGYFGLFTRPVDLTIFGSPEVGDVSMPLDEGWTLLGNPRNEPVAWRFNQVGIVTPGGEKVTMQEMLGASVGPRQVLNPPVHPAAWVFDPRLDDYRVVFDPRFDALMPAALAQTATDHLPPNAGFWMASRVEGASLFLPAATSSGGAAGTEPTGGALASMRRSDGAWSASLVATCGDVRDAANAFGVGGTSRAAGALMPEPPAVARADGAELSLAFINNGGLYAADLRGSVGPNETWRFVIRTNMTDRDVVVSWPDLGSTPSALRFTLVDEATGRRQAMRTTSAYPFRVRQGETQRAFRIEVSDASRSALRLTGLTVRSQAGVRGAGLLVTFNLTRAARVQARLLTPSGRATAALMADLSAGRNTISLAARDAAGRSLPRGVYLVEVIAATDEGQRTRALGAVSLR